MIAGGSSAFLKLEADLKQWEIARKIGEKEGLAEQNESLLIIPKVDPEIVKKCLGHLAEKTQKDLQNLAISFLPAPSLTQVDGALEVLKRLSRRIYESHQGLNSLLAPFSQSVRECFAPLKIFLDELITKDIRLAKCYFGKMNQLYDCDLISATPSLLTITTKVKTLFSRLNDVAFTQVQKQTLEKPYALFGKIVTRPVKKLLTELMEAHKNDIQPKLLPDTVALVWPNAFLLDGSRQTVRLNGMDLLPPKNGELAEAYLKMCATMQSKDAGWRLGCVLVQAAFQPLYEEVGMAISKKFFLKLPVVVPSGMHTYVWVKDSTLEIIYKGCFWAIDPNQDGECVGALLVKRVIKTSLQEWSQEHLEPYPYRFKDCEAIDYHSGPFYKSGDFPESLLEDF